MIQNENTGYLKLILGPMYASKSSKIIGYIRKYKILNLPIMIIKPDIDIRYSTNNELCTHNSEKEQCLVYECSKLNDIFNHELYANTKVIFIEEAQFFQNIDIIVKKMIDSDNKKVYIAALNGDSNRELFGDIYKLLPFCDDIELMQALCIQCRDGTPGIFSKKLVVNQEQIIIGSHETYQSVCRKHYFN
jgi:thymidine kinase